MIIIQDEIKISQKEVDECIAHYARLSDKFRLGILCKVMDKKQIIKEIKALSEIGKEILLMHQKFKEYKVVRSGVLRVS